MADNSIIKISASLDAQSFKAIVEAIRDVTREANQAGEALARMSRQMGGAGTLGVSGTAQQATPAANIAAGQPQMKVNGVAAVMTQGLGNVAGYVRQAADSAVSAARSVGGAVGEMASVAEGKLGQMIGMVQALTGHFTKAAEASRDIGGGSGGGGGGGGWAEGVEGPMHGPWPADPQRPSSYASVSGRLRMSDNDQKAWKAHEAVRASEKKLLDAAMGIKPSLGESLSESPVGQFIGGFIPSGAKAAMARLAPILGPAAAVGAIGYMGYKAYDWVTGARAQVNTANANESVYHQPWYQSDYAATAGQTYGGRAVGVLSGDVSLARAIALSTKDKYFQSLTGRDNTERRFALLAGELGMSKYTSPLDNKSHPSVKGATPDAIINGVMNTVRQKVTTVTDKLGENLDSMAASVSVPLSDDKWLGKTSWKSGRARMAAYGIGASAPEVQESREDKLGIQFRQGSAELVKLQMQEQQKFIQQKQMSDPMFQYMSNSLMGSAFSDMSLYRSAGVGQHEIRDKQGNFINYSGNMFKERLMKRGFTEGEGAALNAQVARTAGRGLMGAGEGLLGMQAGGLYNVAEMFGAGAQMGNYRGGGSPAFLKAIQAAIGRGGIDVTAGADLAQVISQMSMSGHMDVGADKAFEAIAGAMYLPKLAGENMAGRDMRAGKAMAGGLQYMGDLMSGGISPVNRMQALQAAMNATKGNWVQTHAILRLAKNPVELLQALHGDISEGLGGIGITKKMLEDFQAGSHPQHLLNLVPATFPVGTAGGDFAKKLIEMKDKGGMKAAYDSLLQQKMTGKDYQALTALRGKKGLSGKDKTALDVLERKAYDATSKELKGYAEVEAGENGDPNAIFSEMQVELGIRRARGAGAGDVIGKGAPERRAGATQGVMAGEKGKMAKEWLDQAPMPEEIRTVFRKALDQTKEVQGANATDFGQAEGAIMGASVHLSEALNVLAQRILDASQGKKVATSAPVKVPVQQTGVKK